jgi:hypothetical protein
MPIQRRFLIAACVAAATIIQSSRAFCDFIIVSSESPKFAVGQKFSDSAEIDIEDQDQVRVMDQSSGETKLLEGPYKGTIPAYKACQSADRASGACNRARRDKPVGGTRAF